MAIAAGPLRVAFSRVMELTADGSLVLVTSSDPPLIIRLPASCSTPTVFVPALSWTAPDVSTQAMSLAPGVLPVDQLLAVGQLALVAPVQMSVQGAAIGVPPTVLEVVEPSVLVALTLARMLAPRSWLVSVYSVPVAPSMLVQLSVLHRCHW